MILTRAADQLAADRAGTPLEVNESIGPTADGPSGHWDYLTDLGGIDHLFRDPSTTLAHLVSTPLQVASSATSGPNGGLVPGYLQGAVTTIKADGAELTGGSLSGAQSAVSQGPSLAATLNGYAHKLRTALGI